MRRSSLPGILLVLVMLAASDVLAAQNQRRGDRNRLTKDDVAEMSGTVNTAYDLVRMMRPNWLNPPGMNRNSTSNADGTGGGATALVLYINDIRQPTIDEMRTVKASTVVEMRYLDQNRAIQMRGPGHEMGVIEVTTIDKKS